jgi:hypothetical protein
MTLEDLVGEHIMHCAPRTDAHHPFDPNAAGCAFALDRTTYLVFEDPDDGYRSHAMELIVLEKEFYSVLGQGKSPEYFRPALKVTCSMKNKERGEYNILQIHTDTGHLLFEVGTDNTDDYYPCYVAEYNPLPKELDL